MIIFDPFIFSCLWFTLLLLSFLSWLTSNSPIAYLDSRANVAPIRGVHMLVRAPIK